MIIDLERTTNIVIETIAALCVGAVISAVVKGNVPSDLKGLNKIAIAIGTMIITSAIAEPCAKSARESVSALVGGIKIGIEKARSK